MWLVLLSRRGRAEERTEEEKNETFKTFCAARLPQEQLLVAMEMLHVTSDSLWNCVKLYGDPCDAPPAN